jgi:hypothetical protein
MKPRYPVYIISKGRWAHSLRLTSRALEEMRVPYHIVVEPQEFKNYAAEIDSAKILTLPFSNLGMGSTPARNWVWEHSIAQGAKRHFILDDNIFAFMRLNRGEKQKVTSGAIFRAAEDFVDRYENVALAGFNYTFFAPARDALPPFYLNTRCYSAILINNALPFRWEGRYNEDTGLSLRVLKAGYCTILLNAFLIDKTTTMRLPGGNTEELYHGDGNARKNGTDTLGRKLMAESLLEQHPDVVKVVRKFGRWHHHVNYKPFRKNKLVRRPDVAVPEGVNEYGMKLVGDNPPTPKVIKLNKHAAGRVTGKKKTRHT